MHPERAPDSELVNPVDLQRREVAFAGKYIGKGCLAIVIDPLPSRHRVIDRRSPVVQHDNLRRGPGVRGFRRGGSCAGPTERCENDGGRTAQRARATCKPIARKPSNTLADLIFGN